jgi:hypothetical protein
MGDNRDVKPIDAANALIAALRDGDFEALREVLAPDVAFVSAVTAPMAGPDAVTAQLRRFYDGGRYARAVQWQPGSEKVVAQLPLDSYYAAYTWDLGFDAEGHVAKIVQTGVQHTAPLPPTPVRLDGVLAEALRVAGETRNPLIVAYIDAAGRPIQAPRGTVQVYSPTQLALWVHNPAGGLASAVRTNANVSLHYWGGMGTQYGGALSFQGTARIEEDAEARRRVYEGSPASEQRSDPERKGCCIVIDVTSAAGFVAGWRFNMSSDVR